VSARTRIAKPGDRMLVAYDPRKNLPSRPAKDPDTPIRTWMFGVGAPLAALMFCQIVITDALRNRDPKGTAA
jgi:hypothetical protein